ncbi:hypothetical protein O181_091369, partial [Austropuccinia psidii MF-1]|nr:hypothetical protein [Austropuccinia psidii MF-1]
IFKSFTYHGLVDVGFITIHSWPLCLLTVINYLVSTICRIYFARLASTMLRSPQTFLCLSLIFLVLTVVGLTAEVFSIALHASALPFHQVIPHPNQSPVWLILSRPTFFIIIEIIWLISAFAWELMIMRVLLSNFLDPQKRFRFGLIDGKCSFGVTLVFESALLSTLVTMAVIPCYFILTYKVTIDYGRLCIIFGTISSFVAKLDAISILCSLQHKQHSRVRAGLKIISNTMRNPRLSGQRWSVGSGEMMAARKSIKELPTVTFPNLNRNSQLLQRDSIQYQTSEHPTAELRWSEPSSSDRKPTEMNRQLTCSNQSLSSVASLENEGIEKSVKASERSSIEKDLESADHMIVVKNSAVDPLDCDRRRRGTRDFSALPLDTPISLPPPTFHPSTSISPGEGR